jgi:hypothetical protein
LSSLRSPSASRDASPRRRRNGTVIRRGPRYGRHERVHPGQRITRRN